MTKRQRQADSERQGRHDGYEPKPATDGEAVTALVKAFNDEQIAMYGPDGPWPDDDHQRALLDEWYTS